jgi:predicted ferric reductase
VNESILWYAARSTGMVAWALAAAAVVWGLLLSTRSARGLAKPAWVLDLHRFLGVLTLVMTIAHLAALVGDNYVHFGVADLLVPGASAWKTAPVAWGVLAFWLFLAVEVTSLVKKRIAHRTWARVHLLSFVAYVLATAHYLQAGTERTNPVVLLSVEAVSALVVFLTLIRILAPRRHQRRAAAGAKSAAPERAPQPAST